jgi:lysozyme
MNLEQLLTLHEGKRNKPYKDTVGKTTIGIGRNLDDKGLSDSEVLYLFRNDLQQHSKEVEQAFPWVSGLDTARRAVLIDMCFNMGIGGLSQFKRTLELIRNGEYEKAAVAMLQSKWATQVGNRAKRLSEMMRTGSWPKLP